MAEKLQDIPLKSLPYNFRYFLPCEKTSINVISGLLPLLTHSVQKKVKNMQSVLGSAPLFSLLEVNLSAGTRSSLFLHTLSLTWSMPT